MNLIDDYIAGQWHSVDNLLNFLNSLDTEGMSAKEIRSAIYSWGLEYKPSLRITTNNND